MSVATEYVNSDQEPFNRITIVAILLAGAFLAVLNQTLLLTATPHIMAEFELTENIGQWVTTIFMLINGIMIPITALFNGNVYDKTVIFCFYVHIYRRDDYLYFFVSFSDVDDWKNRASGRSRNFNAA